MAAPVKPAIHSALQKTAYWLVPTLTVAGPKKSEIESQSGIYITCFLVEDNTGWELTYNKGQGPRLLCAATQPEVLLPSTAAGADLVGVFDPQAGAGDPDKKAFEFLRNGFTGYMVRRQNKDNSTADTVTVSEFVDHAPVDIAPASTGQTAQTAEGVYIWTAGVAVTGDPVYNVAVVS